MAEDKRNFKIKDSDDGCVKISDEVLAIIAGLAATEVEGVASLAGNLTSDLISKAGASKLSKGVKIIPGEEDDEITVRLAVYMAYGYEIPKVCEQIQDRVRTSIENMTGLEVTAVDIKIAQVIFVNE